MFAKVSDKLHRRHISQHNQQQQGHQAPHGLGVGSSPGSHFPTGRTEQPPDLRQSDTSPTGFGGPKLASPIPAEQPSPIGNNQENQFSAQQTPVVGYDPAAPPAGAGTGAGDAGGTPYPAQPAIMNEIPQNVAGASNHYMAVEKAAEAQKQVSKASARTPNCSKHHHCVRSTYILLRLPLLKRTSTTPHNRPE